MSGTASVIITTHNRPRLLRRALESVVAQDYRPLEVVVVNDGGEPVAAVISEFAPLLPVVAVEHAAQQGLPAARNSGIRAAKGEYLCYLDDDDALLPQHLSRLIGALGRAGAGCAYGDFTLVFEDRQAGQEVERQLRETGCYRPEQIAVECFVPVCAVVHRREVLARVGSFDESLTRGMEDWDLWLRVFPTFPPVHVPGSICLVYQDTAPTNMSTRGFGDFAELTRLLYDRYSRLVAGRPELQRARRKTYEIRRILGELLEAMAKHTQPVTLCGADLLRGRGFGRQVHDLVVALAERTVELDDLRAGRAPLGRRRLLRRLVSECVAGLRWRKGGE